MPFKSPKKRLCLQTAFIVVISTLLSNAKLNADIIMRVADHTMESGTTSSFDIYVSSTSTDSVFIANYQIVMTPVIEFGGRMQFAVPQINNESLNSNYIFGGMTGNFSATRNPVAEQEILTGYDYALSPVDLTETPKLLARVEVTHITDAMPASYGEYHISIVKSDGNTFFATEVGTYHKIVESSYNHVGTINVVAAVPEPSALLLTSLAAIGLWSRRRIKKRNGARLRAMP